MGMGEGKLEVMRKLGESRTDAHGRRAQTWFVGCSQLVTTSTTRGKGQLYCYVPH